MRQSPGDAVYTASTSVFLRVGVVFKVKGNKIVCWRERKLKTVKTLGMSSLLVGNNYIIYVYMTVIGQFNRP